MPQLNSLIQSHQDQTREIKLVLVFPRTLNASALVHPCRKLSASPKVADSPADETGGRRDGLWATGSFFFSGQQDLSESLHLHLITFPAVKSRQEDIWVCAPWAVWTGKHLLTSNPPVWAQGFCQPWKWGTCGSDWREKPHAVARRGEIRSFLIKVLWRSLSVRCNFCFDPATARSEGGEELQESDSVVRSEIQKPARMTAMSWSPPLLRNLPHNYKKAIITVMV